MIAASFGVLAAAPFVASAANSKGVPETSSVSFQPGGQQGVQPTFEQKFWDYLLAEKYTNWSPAPGQGDGFQKSKMPHGAFVKMYLNRTAAGNPKKPPFGSIIVKENYGPMKKKLMAITVMYRFKDYNPKAGDWYWIKYMPNGTVASMKTPKGQMRLGGKVKGCIACHSGAGGDDFVYMNDELK